MLHRIVIHTPCTPVRGAAVETGKKPNIQMKTSFARMEHRVFFVGPHPNLIVQVLMLQHSVQRGRYVDMCA